MKIRELKNALKKFKDDDEVFVWVSHGSGSPPECFDSINEITSIARNGGCQLGIELNDEHAFEDCLSFEMTENIDLSKGRNMGKHIEQVMTVQLLRKFLSDFDCAAQVFLVMIEEDEVYPIDPYIAEDKKGNCYLCIGNSCPCCNPPH